ncbi:MAG: Gfo/Idh/MocA family oxidoreductase [Leptospiraceae bacterium]|nr:Gfo/Idh/MocA family oxidoreductase [Leptospiraceae bacterium]
MQISVLIVGLGQIGIGYDYDLNPEEFILTHARASSVHKKFHLVGGVDSNPVKREKLEMRYQCASYATLDLALKNLKADMVVVATPTDTHPEVINQIFSSYSPKAILCEKPIAYEKKDTVKILELCRRNQTKLYVNYHRRSDAGSLKIKQMLSELPEDERVKGVCWYSKGIINNGSHFINLLKFWLGEVKDFSVIQNGRMWNQTDPEPDVFFQFEKGDIVFLAANEENFSHYTIEIVSSKGRIRYDFGGRKIFWQPKMENPNKSGYTYLRDDVEQVKNDLNFAQLNVYEQIYLDMQNRKAEFCCGEEALDVVKILDKVRAKL